MKLPQVLILQALGTNRDRALAFAFELAGAKPVIHSLWQLRTENVAWQDYQILAIPGGFSYGDVLGAGTLFALDLKTYFFDHIQTFIASGKPVIGICNGFQVLVKMGLLPAITTDNQDTRQATLTLNAKGQFECRWVTLRPQSRCCLWTQSLDELIECPVAHGEGQLQLAQPSLYHTLLAQDQVALCYVLPNGEAAEQCYPFNPSGSLYDIAAICNPTGNVLGLMPHPEDHILAYQHPRWTRGEQGRLGLRLLAQGVHYVNT